MDKTNPKGKKAAEEEYELAEEEYDELELLERLETLREDMEDLGVKTLAEVVQRINELHRKLDQGF